MKKIILLILFAGAFTMFAPGDAYGQLQFSLGLKGGLNFAKVDSDLGGGVSIKNRTGFHAGAFALFKLTKIGIQPEIVYSQQGSVFKYNGDNFKSNFSYVNIPVMLKLYLIAGLNLQVGPQFGFLTKAEGVTDNGQGVPQDGKDVKDQLKKSDVSLGLGVGWDLPFKLTLDARYNIGLTEIDDNSEAYNAAKNQVIQISLGYKFIKLGK